MPTTIVLSVRGGMLQEVFASGEVADLVVVDWDIAPGDHDVIQANIGRRQVQARVAWPVVQPINDLAGSDTEAVIEAACQQEPAGEFLA